MEAPPPTTYMWEIRGKLIRSRRGTWPREPALTTGQLETPVKGTFQVSRARASGSSPATSSNVTTEERSIKGD